RGVSPHANVGGCAADGHTASSRRLVPLRAVLLALPPAFGASPVLQAAPQVAPAASPRPIDEPLGRACPRRRTTMRRWSATGCSAGDRRHGHSVTQRRQRPRRGIEPIRWGRLTALAGYWASFGLSGRFRLRGWSVFSPGATVNSWPKSPLPGCSARNLVGSPDRPWRRLASSGARSRG